MIGDYVTLRPVGEDGKQWVVVRVSGPKEGGMKLSRSGDKSTNSATVKFTVEADVLNHIFPGEDRYFTATLVENTGTEATFLAD